MRIRRSGAYGDLEECLALKAQTVKSAGSVGDPGSIPGWGDPLENETATHSSILAWRIPWMEPGRLGLKESDTTERLHFYFRHILRFE